MTTMLYKCPGLHEIHGGHFDYVIVEDDKIEETLANGWFLTTPEAKQAHLNALAAQEADRMKAAQDIQEPNDSVAAPTRAELEQKAAELQIKFDGRTSDKKLSDLIKATLEE